jgi:aminopeptidase YwaD
VTSARLRQLHAEVSGAIWTSPHPQRLLETLAYEIGPRPPGSPAMQAAHGLLARELQRIGCRQVRTEPLPVLAWHAGEARVQPLTPHRPPLQALQHVHSSPGTVEAPLLDAGNAQPAELRQLGNRIRGAVLLVRGHEITGGKVDPLQQRVAAAVELGAAAVVVMSMYPGTGPATELMSLDAPLPVPVVGLAHEDGAALIAAATGAGPRVRVHATGGSVPGHCANLVGQLGPAAPASEQIIVSAHLDSHYPSAGALDNLSGVIVLLELARALASQRRRFTRQLRLILFTGEEYGFAGSKAYVAEHADELERVQLVFNMDSLYRSTAHGMAVMWAPRLRKHIDAILQRCGRRVDVRDLFCMSSDYLPFMLAGIPAARPATWTSDFPPWSHTLYDTADKVQVDDLRLNAMVFAQMLLHLLTDPRPLPVRRQSPMQVQERLEAENVIDEMRSMGFAVADGSAPISW